MSGFAPIEMRSQLVIRSSFDASLKLSASYSASLGLARIFAHQRFATHCSLQFRRTVNAPNGLYRDVSCCPVIENQHEWEHIGVSQLSVIPFDMQSRFTISAHEAAASA